MYNQDKKIIHPYVVKSLKNLNESGNQGRVTTIGKDSVNHHYNLIQWMGRNRSQRKNNN